MSLGTAIGIDAGLAYSLVVLSVLMLPETRGRGLGEAPLEAAHAGALSPAQRH
jgi:hypothetical protein